jgi:hypothetical protein
MEIHFWKNGSAIWRLPPIVGGQRANRKLTHYRARWSLVSLRGNEAYCIDTGGMRRAVKGVIWRAFASDRWKLAWRWRAGNCLKRARIVRAGDSTATKGRGRGFTDLEEFQKPRGLCEKCKIGASAAEGVLICMAYVAAEPATYKDSRVLTQTLKPR